MPNEAHSTETLPVKMEIVKKGRFTRAKTVAELRRALKLKPASHYKIHKLLESIAGNS